MYDYICCCIMGANKISWIVVHLLQLSRAFLLQDMILMNLAIMFLCVMISKISYNNQLLFHNIIQALKTHNFNTILFFQQTQIFINAFMAARSRWGRHAHFLNWQPAKGRKLICLWFNNNNNTILKINQRPTETWGQNHITKWSMEHSMVVIPQLKKEVAY